MARYVFSHLVNVQSVSLADLVSCYPDVEDQTRISKLYEFSLPEDREDLSKFLTQIIRAVKQKRIEEMASADDDQVLLQMLNMKKQLSTLNITL